MALKIVRGKTLPIGVDLGSSSVKLAQLRLADGEVELLGAGIAELGGHNGQGRDARLNDMCKGIKDALKTGSFKGNHAILAVPAEDTVVQHVRIPKLPPQEIGPAVEAELEGKMPFDVSQAVVRHVVSGELLGEEDPRMEVIAVAISRDQLESYLAMSRRAKLDVVGVNVEAFAVVDCFARLFRRASDASRSILFIDVGSLTTQLVLTHGNRVVFARNLAQGGSDLDKAVAEKLSVGVEEARRERQRVADEQSEDDRAREILEAIEPPIDALGAEMNTCLRYYESTFKGQAVERAIFIGGQASDTRLCRALAKRLNLPAQVGDPLVHIRRTNACVLGGEADRRGPQPRWAVAVGLSLGADRAA